MHESYLPTCLIISLPIIFKRTVVAAVVVAAAGAGAAAVLVQQQWRRGGGGGGRQQNNAVYSQHSSQGCHHVHAIAQPCCMLLPCYTVVLGAAEVAYREHPPLTPTVK